MCEAVEVFRFAALSAAVHADAVESLVADTAAAVAQIARDAGRLDDLERKLTAVVEEQRRLHALREVIARARRERGGGDLCRAEKRCGLARAGVKKQHGESSPRVVGGGGNCGIADVLQFASNAVVEDDIGIVRQGTRRVPAVVSDASMHLGNKREMNTEGEEEEEIEESENIDDVVERVKSQMQLLEGMSVKTKLRELEALKQEVKHVDPNAIMERYVNSFQFPSDVEGLWSSKKNIINRTNIDLFISRASQRMSGRYKDALTAISDFSSYEKSDSARIFGSLLYADALTSSFNYDAAAVKTLQSFGKGSLLNYYKRKKAKAVVSATVRRRRVETVLGSEEFSFLPNDWRSSQDLFTPQDIQLPPARHILTPRFSFADAHELNTLQSLRVDFQRTVLDTFIRMPDLLGELRHQIQANSRQEEKQDEEKEERDVAVSLIRLLTEKKSGGSVWLTIAQCAPSS